MKTMFLDTSTDSETHPTEKSKAPSTERERPVLHHSYSEIKARPLSMLFDSSPPAAQHSLQRQVSGYVLLLPLLLLLRFLIVPTVLHYSIFHPLPSSILDHTTSVLTSLHRKILKIQI